jgi:N-formylglutamate amidohydrolase
MNNIILHIPHSSKVIPFEYLGDYFDVVELNETLLKLTDTFTDELFSIDGVPKIIFPYSRVFCDVERFLQNEPMETKYGQGFFYTNSINLKPFRNDINKDVIRDKYYYPHHSLIRETIQLMDNPLLIDCHSFSNEIYPCTPFNVIDLPDFIIGHNEKEREKKISTMIYDYLSNLGFKVNINQPYNGSLIADNCDSIMIEINKHLYLSSDYFSKRGDYYKTEHIIKTIIKQIKNI